MRMRLSIDCRANKMLAEIEVVVAMLNEANEVSLMR